MEHERQAWNLDQILEENATGQNIAIIKSEGKRLGLQNMLLRIH